LKVIGLCGGSGSGKGLVCQYFADFNIISIDTDAVYHELISSPGGCLDEIANAFGKEVVVQGSLDRHALASIVFSDREKLNNLNTITHKHILARVRELIAEYKHRGYQAVLVDAPLLFESSFDAECDITICVCADESLRIERIIARDSISREKAEERIKSQIADDELRKKCDYVIENNCAPDELKNRVAQLIKQIFEF